MLDVNLIGTPVVRPRSARWSSTRPRAPAPTAFTLASTATSSPFVRLNLLFDAPNNNFLLVGLPDQPVFETVDAGRDGDQLLVPQRRRDLRPARGRARRHRAGGRRRSATSPATAASAAGSSCSPAISSATPRQSFTGGGDTTVFDTSYEQDFEGIQGGLDYQSGGTILGVSFGLGRSDAEFDASLQRARHGRHESRRLCRLQLRRLLLQRPRQGRLGRRRIARRARGLSAEFDATAWGLRGTAGFRFELGQPDHRAVGQPVLGQCRHRRLHGRRRHRGVRRHHQPARHRRASGSAAISRPAAAAPSRRSSASTRSRSSTATPATPSRWARRSRSPRTRRARGASSAPGLNFSTGAARGVHPRRARLRRRARRPVRPRRRPPALLSRRRLDGGATAESWRDAGFDLRPAWRRDDPQIEADAIDFWNRLGILPPDVSPRSAPRSWPRSPIRTAGSSACITAGSAGSSRSARGSRMLRGAVDPDHRRTHVALRAGSATRATCSNAGRRSIRRSGSPASARSSKAAICSPRAQRSRSGRSTRFGLIGYTPDGRQIRVSWFERFPAGLSALGGGRAIRLPNSGS